MKPTYQEQIASHRKSIEDLSTRAALLESCYGRRAAAWHRQMIADCESCIRSCERMIAAETVTK